jgi:hypothetical protein
MGFGNTLDQSVRSGLCVTVTVFRGSDPSGVEFPGHGGPEVSDFVDVNWSDDTPSASSTTKHAAQKQKQML